LLRAYLPEAQDQALDLAALALQLRQDAINLALRDPNPKVWWGLVNQEDWASSWKKHWQPQKVGDRFLVKATLQNRHLNRIGTQKLIVQQGSLENLLEVMEAPVDGLVCNIQLDVILDILPKFNLIAKPETWGILSGILVDQADSISEALRKHGWFVANLWHRQQWCCFDIRRDSL